VWALGLAATQSAGLREMFGSMGKAFHPGRSAQNGYAAALLAKSGFTSGERGIEGPRGFAHVLAPSRDLAKIGTRLGVDFDLRENTYKPFPCGIVNHPTIDGAIRIHHEHTPDPDAIVAVRLRVAPLVLDLCNQQNITRGLQGKFSVYHGAAVGLVRGKGGLREYTDDAVNDPAIKRVRESATAVGDPSITEDQAHIEVELKDGRRLTTFVEQSLGNIHRPLTDRQLDDKFRDQAVMVLPSEDVDRLIDLCWRIDALEDVGELVNAAVPVHARVARASVAL
jgi:2-methylcitrate dehydratase PrpD